MKRFLTVLGIIFVVLLLCIGAFIGYAAFAGSKLDASSKAFVDDAIPGIVGNWSADKLLEHASSQLLKVATESQVRRLFVQFSSKLGSLVRYEGSKGYSNISITPQTGRVISARYMAHATFQQGAADITILLLQERESVWSIAGFNVNSEALMR